MNRISRLLAFSFFCASSALVSNAQTLVTIPIGSNSAATYEYNSLGTPSVAVANTQVWSSAIPFTEWISYAQTGTVNAPDYVDVPVGTSVDFFVQFNIPSNGGQNYPYDSGISVMAADTAEVYVNGNLLVSAATAFGGTYYGCADTAIGCRSTEQGDYVIPASYLQLGINTIKFTVSKHMTYNLAQSKTGFGLDYGMRIRYVTP